MHLSQFVHIHLSFTKILHALVTVCTSCNRNSIKNDNQHNTSNTWNTKNTSDTMNYQTPTNLPSELALKRISHTHLYLQFLYMHSRNTCHTVLKAGKFLIALLFTITFYLTPQQISHLWFFFSNNSIINMLSPLVFHGIVFSLRLLGQVIPVIIRT